MGFKLSHIFNVKSITGENAANRAAAAQTGAAQAGMAAQEEAKKEAQTMLQPYADAGLPGLQGMQPYAQAGLPAFEQQQAAIGLQGPEAQQQYIQQLEQSPYMQAMMQQGENALLQNASATGGLRGGNMQAALAQFRPEMMQAYENQQYGRLGGIAQAGMQTQGNLAQLGQSAAAGQAAQSLQTGANLANLHGQIGAAEAGKQNAITSGRMGLLGMGISAGGALAAGGAFGAGNFLGRGGSVARFGTKLGF